MSAEYTTAIAELRKIIARAPRGSEIHRRCQSALVALQTAQQEASKRG